MPEFKDVAEAKKAMLEVFTALQGNKTEIEAAVTAAGDDLQKKMMTVIPLLQNTLAGPLATYGFPAGGPGIMAGIGAFTKASLTEGEPSVLKEGMDMLKQKMMGSPVADDKIEAFKAKLQA